MSWETPDAHYEIPSRSAAIAAESTHAFMAKVYRWMFTGLAVTGLTAYLTAATPSLMEKVLPLYVPLIIGQLVLVMALSFLVSRVSGPVAALMFLGYSFLTGLTFSVLFLVYELGSIGQAFLIAGATFLVMSIYGTVTKKDLTSWRTFLMMGLIGLFIAGLVQMFIRSSALSFMWSCVAVVVFTGLTAYDTQKLRRYHAEAGHSEAGNLAITGALMLYLDFINLFLALLRLLGRRR